MTSSETECHTYVTTAVHRSIYRRPDALTVRGIATDKEHNNAH